MGTPLTTWEILYLGCLVALVVILLVYVGLLVCLALWGGD